MKPGSPLTRRAHGPDASPITGTAVGSCPSGILAIKRDPSVLTVFSSRLIVIFLFKITGSLAQKWYKYRKGKGQGTDSGISR